MFIGAQYGLVTSRKNHEKQGPVLIFIHVPKTAGTSFYQLIEKNYPKENRFLFNINKGKNPIPKLKKTLCKKQIRIIYGHGTFGLREICPDSKYVTFVRHPVSHTLSNYHYIRTSPHNRLHREVRDMSFSEFIKKLRDFRHDNQHYRQLTNTLFRIENSEYYFKKIIPDLAGLEYAVNTIDHLYRFEELDLAVDQLAGIFNWKYRKLEHQNVSKKDDIVVHDEDIANILSINHLDWLLYRRSVSLLPEKNSIVENTLPHSDIF